MGLPAGGKVRIGYMLQWGVTSGGGCIAGTLKGCGGKEP
jgi:hypothetical protein